MDQPHDLTIILKEASGGDREAMGRIVSLVYGELRAIARRQHAGEQAGHSLNTTGIVHEAYLNLAATLADGQVDELLELDIALQGLEAMNERHLPIERFASWPETGIC